MVVNVFRLLSTARHDALFVVGPLDETMMLRGMRYHPVDIENTVTRCHRSICERYNRRPVFKRRLFSRSKLLAVIEGGYLDLSS